MTSALALIREMPRAADLAKTPHLPRVIGDLMGLIMPLFTDGIAMDEARYTDEAMTIAQRILAAPLPRELENYPEALAALITTPPDAIAIGRLVSSTIDTRTAYRPPDMTGYVVSIVDCLTACNFGMPVVSLACTAIREADPAEFRHQLPSEFHFIAACERAQDRLKAAARALERVLATRSSLRASLAEHERAKAESVPARTGPRGEGH